MIDPEKEQWYKARGVTHAHCPYECEHPQPFMDGGKLFCGRCYFVEKKVTEMIPCTWDVCD